MALNTIMTYFFLQMGRGQGRMGRGESDMGRMGRGVGDMGKGTWGGGHKHGHNGASVNWEVFRVVKDWSLNVTNLYLSP
jgi:hypothetical protein